MKELISHFCRVCQVLSSGLGSHPWSFPGTVPLLVKGIPFSTFFLWSHQMTLVLCWDLYLSNASTLFHIINPGRQEKTCFVAIHPPFYSRREESKQVLLLTNLAHCISYLFLAAQLSLAWAESDLSLWHCLHLQLHEARGATPGF